MSDFKISFTEKPKQSPRTVSENVNGWPDNGVYKVVSIDTGYRTSLNEPPISVGDRILFMKGAALHLDGGQIYPYGWSRSLFEQDRCSIIRDFSIQSVTLYVDAETNPEAAP